MKSRFILAVLICLLAVPLALAPGAEAQGRAPSFLTGPQEGDPLGIALSYVRSQRQQLGLTEADLADPAIKNQFSSRHNGTTHIHMRQRIAGLEVANAHMNVNVAADGSVINMGSSFVGDVAARVNTLAPGLTREAAIERAAAHLGLATQGTPAELGSTPGPTRAARFAAEGVSQEEIPVHLTLYATDAGVRLAWEMVIYPESDDHLWNLWVDAVTGEVLAKNDWTSYDSYEVYALPKEHPNDGPRTVELNPADSTASPFGWHDTNGAAGAEFITTRGNNVCAQEDRDANNSACGTGLQPSSATLDFSNPLDLALQPSTYQEAAVTNLFYWNNVIHDVLYHYGFDEASGNFQENNYGRGGLAGDSVNADAQDGSGTNNANFSTPPEGGPFNPHPRMQMFEWTPPNTNEVVVDSGTAAGSYSASGAEFGPALSTTGVSSTIVAALDGTGTATDACEALTNGGTVNGNIALVDRGSCSFVTKVRNAQNAGAVGVIVANNAPGNPITLGDDGTGGDITISSVMVSQADGATIRAGLPAPGTIRAAPSPPPNRDSDLDNGVIAHEYCHGLSIRLTGGPGNSNCLSGNQQAGEGWSDFCALFFTADATDTATTARGIGTYVIFEPTTGQGIRPAPYSTDMTVNPLTYGDLATGSLSVPHGVGTVWATAVWEMYWNLVGAHGFDPDLYNGTGGNNLAMQLVVDGLKLQPCNPTFLDGRDAILLADQNNNGGANECLIWEAFAKRGMGVNAQDGGSSSSLAVTENFDLPAQCVTGCGNGTCEAGEDCNSCPSDCPSGSAGAQCGNGICEAGNGEDCVSCPADCNGRQGGRPANRFCCGDGDGVNPVTCADSRCTSSGFQCTTVPVPPSSLCCGDLACDPGETCANCALDCTLGAEVCTGGVDDDCDGAVDCNDSDCASDPACTCAPKGASCTSGGQCCSGVCKNNGTCR